MEVIAEKNVKFNKDSEFIWGKIIEPSFMVKTVPGAELTDQIDKKHFKGKLSLKIGPITTNFNGEAEFTKLDESNKELILEGKGQDTSGKGGAKLTMNIKLITLDQNVTEMYSCMKLSITGKIAQFGSRMIVAVNNKMFEQWVMNFTNLLNDKIETNKYKDNKNKSLNNPKTIESSKVNVISVVWTAIKSLFGNK